MADDAAKLEADLRDANAIVEAAAVFRAELAALLGDDGSGTEWTSGMIYHAVRKLVEERGQNDEP